MRHVELPPILSRTFPVVPQANKRLVAGEAVAEAARTLGNLLLGDGDDVDVDGVELRKKVLVGWILEEERRSKTYAEGLEEVLGVLVDVEHARLGVLGEVESRDLGDVLVLALALLFLELERDTADGTTLDTLHQVSGVTGDLWKNISFLRSS